jgi:hypothetical protein
MGWRKCASPLLPCKCEFTKKLQTALGNTQLKRTEEDPPPIMGRRNPSICRVARDCEALAERILLTVYRSEYEEVLIADFKFSPLVEMNQKRWTIPQLFGVNKEP